MNPTPPADLPLLRLNAAESVFAFFNDFLLSARLPVTVECGAAKDLRSQQMWDRFHIRWGHALAGEIALRIHLTGRVRTAGFDAFTFCFVSAAGLDVRFLAKQAGCEVALGPWAPTTGIRMEVTVPIPPGEVDGITMEVVPQNPEAGEIALHWFGVTKTGLLGEVLHYEKPYGHDWGGLILLEERWPKEISFEANLLFSPDDLGAIREKLARAPYTKLLEGMLMRVGVDLARQPEDFLGEHVPWTDSRYLRARERDRPATYLEAMLCGFVALVKQDVGMARHAMRHLLTLAHTDRWCDSGEMHLQGSTWDQRCFQAELTTTSVSLLLDWFGWALAPAAKELVRQAIWDKGLAIIERDMMKFGYLYKINQGPWFCRARILGGLMLEAGWPRVGNYVERAKTDMLEGLHHYILPDGGIDEGVMYLLVTMEATLTGLHAYARSRGCTVRELLPPQMEKTIDYIQAMSDQQPGCFVLDGDIQDNRVVHDGISILASLFTEQPYAKIAGAALPIPTPKDAEIRFRQFLSGGVFSAIFGPQALPESESIVPEFVILPVTGQLVSERPAGNRRVRLQLYGCKAFPSHSHADKGNIVLQVDGQWLFIDRGVTRYDDARSPLLKSTRCHNVISPIDENGVCPDQLPPEEPVLPSGSGNAAELHASIDLSHVWRGIMTRCRRTIESPSPTEFIIIDDGDLITPSAIAFHLHSLAPFQIQGTHVVLFQNGVRVEIDAPWAASATQSEDLVDLQMRPVHHLIIRSKVLQNFCFQTRIRLHLA